MSEPTAPTDIAVAVVVSGGRVLVGRRGDDAADAPGMSEFPGGKVEPGEAVECAVARECHEESGIAVIVGPRLDLVRSTSSRGPILIHFHLASPVDAGCPPRAPFAWVPIGELSRCRFPSANAGAVSLLPALERSGRSVPDRITADPSPRGSTDGSDRSA